MRFIQFELRLLWQNKLFKWLMLAYLLAAVLAIIWGQIGLEREYQQRTISEVNYQAELADYQEDAPLVPYDSGYMSYYQFHPVWQKPSAWSALIHGERSEAAYPYTGSFIRFAKPIEQYRDWQYCCYAHW